MTILGIIPARAGSKRAPGKNMADLCGRPLIQWTIDAAMESNLFDDIVVTTDDTRVSDFVLQNYFEDDGLKVIHRPIELALDSTPMLPVVKHAVHYSPQADCIVLLQPTSPFRTPGDIQRAHSLLVRSGGDAIVSITEPEEDLVFSLGHANRLLPRLGVVVPNGAIYIITAESLERGENWYSGLTYAYPMPKDRSLDINTPLDLAMAKAVAEQHEAA